jgi:hypothetical protein
LIAISALTLVGEASAALPEYVQNSNPVAADQSSEAFATCPAGTRVVGGGAFLSGTSLETEIKSSAPYDGVSDNDTHPDDGWGAAGNAGPSQETLTAHAICSERRHIRYASAKRKVGFGKERSATAECPRGTVAISGGIKAPHNALTQIRLMSSERAGARRWTGRVVNDTLGNIKMRAWAICADVKTRTASAFNGVPVFLDNTQDSMTTPACSTGPKYAVTGIAAAVINTPSGTEIATLIPVDLDADADPSPNDGAKAWFNNQSGGSQQMSVAAICARL